MAEQELAGIEDDQLEQAHDLVDAGNKAEARPILQSIVRSDSDNLRAWVLMARAAQSREEAISALQEVLRLRPNFVWARRRLERW